MRYYIFPYVHWSCHKILLAGFQELEWTATCIIQNEGDHIANKNGLPIMVPSFTNRDRGTYCLFFPSSLFRDSWANFLLPCLIILQFLKKRSHSQVAKCMGLTWATTSRKGSHSSNIGCLYGFNTFVNTCDLLISLFARVILMSCHRYRGRRGTRALVHGGLYYKKTPVL